MAWLHSVYFIDAARGWAVGGNGVLLSTMDGGATWKALRRPTEDALRDVYFVDAATGWLVCDRSDFKPRSEGESRSYLLKTTDGGGSWTRVEATGADKDVRLVRVVFAGRERGWTFGEAGALYATEDGGLTWSRRVLPTRHLLLGGAFLDAQRGWLVGAGATALYTTDGGTTWREGQVESRGASQSESGDASAARLTNVSAPQRLAGVQRPPLQTALKLSARLRAVTFVNARRGFAVGSGGRIFTTTNGGATWRELDSGVANDLLDVKFFDEAEGFAAGEGGTLLHTRDGGATWRIVPSGTTHALERLSFAGRTRAWAVGFGGTILTCALDAPAATPHLKRVE